MQQTIKKLTANVEFDKYLTDIQDGYLYVSQSHQCIYLKFTYWFIQNKKFGYLSTIIHNWSLLSPVMWEGVYLTVYIYNDNADWYFQWNLFFYKLSLLMLWMFINCQVNNAFLWVLLYGNHLILYAYYILIDKSEKKTLSDVMSLYVE